MTARTVGAFGEIGVGAGLQQQPHDTLVAALCGGRKRAFAALFIPVRRSGAAAQQLGHPRGVAHGRGYRDRVIGAAGDQVERHSVVVALSPVGVDPQRQRQRPKTAPADAVVAAEAGRVDVGAGVEQQVHQITAAGFHRVVQRPSAQVVAAFGELPVRAQQPLHAGRVAGGQRGMDRVPRALGREPATQLPAQVVGYLLVAAVHGHPQQRVVAVQRVAMGQVGARGDQQAHRVQVPLAYREVQRRHVPVRRPYQGGVAFQRGAQRRHVARAGGRKRFPDSLAPAARCPKFPRPDETRFGHSAPSRYEHPIRDSVTSAGGAASKLSMKGAMAATLTYSKIFTVDDC